MTRSRRSKGITTKGDNNNNNGGPPIPVAFDFNAYRNEMKARSSYCERDLKCCGRKFPFPCFLAPVVAKYVVAQRFNGDSLEYTVAFRGGRERSGRPKAYSMLP